MHAVESVEVIGRRICLIFIILLKVFSVICDPIPASLLPVKAMVLYISHTHDFETSKKMRLIHTFF